MGLGYMKDWSSHIRSWLGIQITGPSDSPINQTNLFGEYTREVLFRGILMVMEEPPPGGVLDPFTSMLQKAGGNGFN